MTIWTCPECDRQFGATKQSHMCAPGLTVDEFIDTHGELIGPVLERVQAVLQSVNKETDGDLIVDPLEKKVLFKNGPTFCIVEPKTRWVAVGFSLRRRIESNRLSRKVADNGNKFFHVVNVDDPTQIDEEFELWLTESYYLADPEAADEFRAANGLDDEEGTDPMVPDDIDIDLA